MKSILFNTDSVRAILDGRKSVTRRVLKPQPENVIKEEEQISRALSGADPYGFFVGVLDTELLKNSHYHPGDILYVRETFRTYCGISYAWHGGVYDPVDDFEGYNYKADDFHFTTGWLDPFDDSGELDSKYDIEYSKWRPSIHMPKEAARLFLRVTDVRVERLQDITELQILEEEGVQVDFPQPKPSYLSIAYAETRLNPVVRDAFSKLWDSTIKKADLHLYGWTANPWVWVISFERISKEEAQKCGDCNV